MTPGGNQCEMWRRPRSSWYTNRLCMSGPGTKIAPFPQFRLLWCQPPMMTRRRRRYQINYYQPYDHHITLSFSGGSIPSPPPPPLPLFNHRNNIIKCHPICFPMKGAWVYHLSYHPILLELVVASSASSLFSWSPTIALHFTGTDDREVVYWY